MLIYTVNCNGSSVPIVRLTEKLKFLIQFNTLYDLNIQGTIYTLKGTYFLGAEEFVISRFYCMPINISTAFPPFCRASDVILSSVDKLIQDKMTRMCDH